MARTVFTNAQLFDGQNEPRRGVHVVVSGRRVESLSEGTAPQAGEDDRSVDLAGRTLMPGMVQGHFHTHFGAFGSGISSPILGLEATPAYHGILAARNVQTALNCGFTSIIGSSNADGVDLAVKDAVGHGLIPGPRILACTREFMTTGEQADGNNSSWFMNLGNRGLTRTLDGAEQWRHATREEIGRGCDVVKVSSGQGHGAAPTVDECYMTDAELEAVVSVAHSRGALVRSHCPTRPAILQAARLGVDIIDHADRIDAECIDAILKAGSIVAPSMLFSFRLLQMIDNWDPEAGPFPMGGPAGEHVEDTQQRLRLMREDWEHTCRFMPEAAAAGIKMIVGDDFGVPGMPHGDYAAELELYVKQLGVSAQEVLTWATRNGASLMGRGDELGTIAPGKLADLIVIEGDPLSDITCLKDPARVSAVLKSGEWLKDTL